MVRKEVKDYKELMLIASQYAKNKKYDEALEIYRKLYKMGYRTRRLFREVIFLLYKKEEYTKCYEMLVEFIRLFSIDSSLSRLLFLVIKRLGIELEQGILNEILKKTYDEESLIRIFNYLRRRGKYKEAISVFRRILMKNANVDENLLSSFVFLVIKKKAWNMLEGIRNVEVVNIIRQLVNLDIDSIREEVKFMLKIEKFNRNEMLMFLLGVLLKEFGEYRLAVECFSYANKVNYKEVYVRNIAFLLGKYGDYENAFKMLCEFLEKNPRDFYVWKSLYKLAKEQNMLDKLHSFLLELNEKYQNEKAIWGYIRKVKKHL